MRRLVSFLLVLLTALVVVSACAAPAPTPTPTKAPTPAAKVAEPTKASPAAAPTVPPGQKELVLMGFGGTQEKAFKEAMIPPFEKKYGVKVTWVTATSGIAAAAKIIAEKARPEIDVLYISDAGFFELKKAGVLTKFDLARITNYPNIYDIFKDPDIFGVCQGQVPLGILYNTKIFREKGFAPPNSWYDFWRPELKGRVALGSINIATTQGFLPLLAKLESGNPKNIDAALAKIKTLVPNLAVIYTSTSQPDDLFKTETIWMANNNAQRTYSLKTQGVPVEFVYPKEGAPYFTNWYVVPKGAPHTELGMEFVNYAIDQEAQLAWTERTSFGPCNKTVKLPPELAAQVVYGPEGLAKVAPTDWEWIADNLKEWTERWNKEIESQ